MGVLILYVFTLLLPVISAVLVAVLNNWEKLNPGKKYIKEILNSITEMKSDINLLKSKINKLSSAQRTGLQTQILEKCRKISVDIDNGDIDYEEELKQLIILYREYYLCGFNSQGKLYFNDTIKKASEINSTLVHELMNRYFSDYDPS